jgi:hypothetical protein
MSTNVSAATEHQVAETLRSIAGPVFAAVWEETKQKTELVVHASAGRGQRELRLNIISALNGIGVTSVKVNFHPVSSLLSPKSLERLVSKFAGSKIVYDPTQSLSRAKALVQASHAVRAALGERVRGLFYAPRLRTYYVTLESSKVVVGDKVKISELASIERAVLAAVGQAFVGESAESPAVRVGFGLPAASLVPVDQKSVMGWNARVAGAVKRYWKPVTVAALFGFGATAARADDPAVAEPNLKVSSSFGNVIDDYTWQVQGQFTAPIGESMGFAVEAGGGAVDGHDYYGAAGHLFVRDPDSYLIGVFGGYGESSDFAIDVARAGIEGEFYLSSLTIAGTAGYQFSSAIGDSAFGSIDIRWYVTNNFYLSGGGMIEDDRAYGRIGTEWQPGFAALPGLAFNAQGVWGEDDYHSIMGGLTYYFGVPASLKDRHRKYDPDSALFGLFQSVQQEQARLCAAYGAPTNCQ